MKYVIIGEIISIEVWHVNVIDNTKLVNNLANERFIICKTVLVMFLTVPLRHKVARRTLGLCRFPSV